MTDLIELIDLGEGYKIEFKESIDKDFARELVAFANASGGRILLGTTDKGKVKGFTADNRARSRIQDMARNCDPPLDIEFEQMNSVLVVHVPEGKNKPYSCGSGFYLRQGPNSQKMSRDEILDLSVYEGHIKFDEQLNSKFTYPDDFDAEKFNYYLSITGIDKTDNPEELLLNLGIFNKEMKFNNAGVLFFAKKPDKFIRCSKVVCCLFGHSRAEILDRKEFDGGVIANIEEATNYVTRHIDVRYEIKNLRRKEIPEYPLEAYREAIVNAILHRDFFDISGDVVIEVHKNNLQITNPGGLVKGLDKSNFGKLSRPRNRLMADLLLRTELVERLGTGITRIRSACKTANLPPPEFEFDDYNFLVTISGPGAEIGEVGEAVGVPVKTSASTGDFGARFEEKFGVKFGEILHHEGVGEGVNEGVKARLEKELLFLSEHGHIRRPEMERIFGISTATAERDFALLRRLDLIVFEGAPKTGKYVLTEKGKNMLSDASKL